MMFGRPRKDTVDEQVLTPTRRGTAPVMLMSPVKAHVYRPSRGSLMDLNLLIAVLLPSSSVFWDGDPPDSGKTEIRLSNTTKAI
jgi:hypothetical protein